MNQKEPAEIKSLPRVNGYSQVNQTTPNLKGSINHPKNKPTYEETIFQIINQEINSPTVNGMKYVNSLNKNENMTGLNNNIEIKDYQKSPVMSKMGVTNNVFKFKAISTTNTNTNKFHLSSNTLSLSNKNLYKITKPAISPVGKYIPKNNDSDNSPRSFNDNAPVTIKSPNLNNTSTKNCVSSLQLPKINVDKRGANFDQVVKEKKVHSVTPQMNRKLLAESFNGKKENPLNNQSQNANGTKVAFNVKSNQKVNVNFNENNNGNNLNNVRNKKNPISIVNNQNNNNADLNSENNSMAQKSNSSSKNILNHHIHHHHLIHSDHHKKLNFKEKAENLQTKSINFSSKNNNKEENQAKRLKRRNTINMTNAPKINLMTSKEFVKVNGNMNTLNNFNFKGDSEETLSSSSEGEDNKYIIDNYVDNYAYKTQAGKNEFGQTKTNQDSYLVVNNILNLDNYNIFGIQDGHGINGHLVSGEVTKYLYDYFVKYNNYMSNYEIGAAESPNPSSFGKTFSDYLRLGYGKTNNVSVLKSNEMNFDDIKEDFLYEKLVENHYEVIRKAFRNADNELNNAKYDISMSGCTCNVVFVFRDKIICANVGDSRAILVDKNMTSLKQEQQGNNKRRTSSILKKLKNNNGVKAMSIDHKPELENEKKRIISCGGKIEKDADEHFATNPYRVYVKNEKFPGLAMSRALGDRIAKRVGVISDPGIKKLFNFYPEILEFNITKDTKYLVVASDGLWEFIKNSRVMNIVDPFYLKNDPVGACNALIKESTEMWGKSECAVDDITIIVVFFKYRKV